MAMSSKTTEVRVARIEERLRIRLHLPAIISILACTVNRTSLGQAAGDSLVTRFTRAVFNRLDAEPGVTQRHSKNPPVSPLRKGGKKTRRRRLSPPCEGGGRGGESRGACNASENRSRVGRAQRGPADLIITGSRLAPSPSWSVRRPFPWARACG